MTFQAITRELLRIDAIDTSLVDTAISLFEMAAKKGSLTDSDIGVIKCWPEWEDSGPVEA